MCTRRAIAENGPVGVLCPEAVAPEQVAAQPVVTADLVLQAFREVPLPASVLVVQPPEGETLVNFDTNFYTEADEFSVTVELLGVPVDLLVRPASFAWSFGDGATRTTTTPGAAYPDLEVTHRYARPGTVTTAVTVVWAADFSVAGGPWQTVDGTVAMASAGIPLRVREATPVLVD